MSESPSRRRAPPAATNDCKHTYLGLYTPDNRIVGFEIVVPTAVRVEAAWARTRPSAAAINRYRVRDHPLDTASADVAAELQRATATGVADAHLGATVHSCSPGEVVVLTSDPADVAAVCSPTPATIVAI